MPVRVAAHAFGAGQPARDLWLSPDHAVFVENVLIPVRHLVNGVTVQQVEVDAITYYHIETERHELVLAEGLATETYLETGNRAAFANGDRVAHIHPDFGRRSDHHYLMWETFGCAPLRVTGEEVERARRTLCVKPRRFAARARMWRMRGTGSAGSRDLVTDASRSSAGRACSTRTITCSTGWTCWRPASTRLDIFADSAGASTAGRTPISIRPGMPNTIRSGRAGPLAHYVAEGEAGGLRPSLAFDPAWYREGYDLPEGCSPLRHYLGNRQSQALSPLPLFDVGFYIRRYGQDIPAGRDPFTHYLISGAARDFDPSPWFNSAAYRRRHMPQARRRRSCEIHCCISWRHSCSGNAAPPKRISDPLLGPLAARSAPLPARRAVARRWRGSRSLSRQRSS